MTEPVKMIEELLDKVPSPEPPEPPEPDLSFEANHPHRKFYKVEYMYGGYGKAQVQKSSLRSEADLVSSETTHGTHAPAIDIDLPCRLLPSGTPGHFHLYIDSAMPWKKYKKLLKALVKAEIVEPGYYKMSKKNRASFLRLPEKPKSVSKVVAPPSGGYW